jgi:hypothetical protein
MHAGVSRTGATIDAMRLLATADLHFDHPRSRPLAMDLIEQINARCAIGDIDALLLVGDTARGDGDSLETALALFRFAGPRLFVAGNHELWTLSADTRQLLHTELPRRVRMVGWRWIQDEPFRSPDGVAIVGSIGWYDYSFAPSDLGIPNRYYQAKISPGVAERLESFRHLVRGDESPAAMQIIARWNDGRFVRLGRSDTSFLKGLLTQLDRNLDRAADARRVVCAVHHVPFPELLPPRHGAQWDFARAYLGSGQIGQTIARYENVSHAFCGHSHFPMRAHIGHITAINIGSGYRQKRYEVVDV